MLIRAQLVESGTFSCTTTTPISVNIHGLDVTDPLQTSGISQPLGFDQWKALYKRAKVVGMKVTYTAHNAGSVATVMGMTLIPENNTNTLTPWNDKAEAPGTKYRILSPDVDHGTLAYRTSTKKVMKIANIKDNDDIACDLTTPTSPNRKYEMSIWAALHNGTTTTAVDWIAKIEYLILLDQYIIPARSDA